MSVKSTAPSEDPKPRRRFSTKLDSLLSLAVAAIVGGVLLAGGMVVASDERQSLSECEKGEIETTSLILSSSVAEAADLAQTHTVGIANSPGAISLLKAGDRDGLQARMLPTYQALHGEVGVNVLHFHTADLHSFLRVQQPEKFGEDLSKTRPLLLAANRTRKSQKGLESGRTGLGARAATALMEDGQLIGTVEVGVDLAALLARAKSSTNSDFAIYLRPPADAGVDAKMTRDSATDTKLFNALSERGFIRFSREAILDQTTIDGHTYDVRATPLIDFSGKAIGMMVVASDFTMMEGHVKRTLVSVIAISVVGFVVAFGLVLVVIRGLITRPIVDLTGQVKGADVGAEPTSALTEFRNLHSAVLQALRRTPVAGPDGGETR